VTYALVWAAKRSLSNSRSARSRARVLGRFAGADAREVGRELLDLDVGADGLGVPVRAVGAMVGDELATLTASGGPGWLVEGPVG
jgi:hypothetical protein